MLYLSRTAFVGSEKRTRAGLRVGGEKRGECGENRGVCGDKVQIGGENVKKGGENNCIIQQ
jgi:hypothetical protein